jgi:hypothetical protein
MPLYDDDDYDDRPVSRRRRYEDDEYEYDFRKRDLPHSGVGMASCVLALLAVLIGAFAMVLIADVGPDEIEAAIEAEEPEAVLAMLLFVGAGLVSLIGLVLAIAGLLQQDRNKLFAILGLCLNGLLFLCGLAMMVAGMLAD